MRLLHGSYTEILTPNLSKCKGKNDFGKGFYLTPNWKRAWQMGKRSTFLHGGKITVNAFLFYPNIGEKKGLQIKIFEGFTTEWAKFILQNREESGFKHDYDIVIGPIADDRVGVQLWKYESQLIDLPTLIKRLKYMKGITFQYFFGTERAIKLLKRI